MAWKDRKGRGTYGGPYRYSSRKSIERCQRKSFRTPVFRFENRDKAVLTELGDFYLLVLDEQDFENAYLWYNVASALGVENSAEKRDKVEKELEPDTIVKIQVASRKRYEEFTKKELMENQGKNKKRNRAMKVKVHWVIDGIAEVEAETLEDAEKIVNERLSEFVSNNPDIEKKWEQRQFKAKGYLPGSDENG